MANKLTPEDKQAILDIVSQLLDEPDVMCKFSRSVKRTTKPDDEWETHEAGHGRRFKLEIPCKKDEYYNHNTD